MLKEHFSAVSLAVFLHALLLLMISQTYVIPSFKTTVKTTPKLMKSFLYVPPQKAHPAEANPQSQKSVKETIQDTTKENQQSSGKEIVNQTFLAVKEQQSSVHSEHSPQSTTESRFSSIRQLEQLKQQLNNKTIELEVTQLTRRKSISVLDGQPQPVPHSEALSQEKQNEQYKQSTFNLSGDVKIVKGDDGSCYIEKDLSNVGMEGLSSVESFSCGQSKFDKSFKAHMEKVLKKLGK